MSDRGGKTALGWLGIAVLLVMIIVQAWRLNDFGSQPKATQYLWIAVLSLSVRSARPGAVVVKTSWAELHTEYFLKRGPLARKARGRAGHLILVADAGGIELIRPRGLFSFGLIHWALVKDIRLDVFTAPLASRPKLVIEIQGGSTPYSDFFELLPEGKEERASAAEKHAAILSKRPVDRR